MAYDAAQAHEYYIKYRKKGLKKGRKTGTTKKKSTSKKSTRTISLVGLSTSGLNDNGRMQAALIKEDLKNEMNEAMGKAKTLEERGAIRQQYQQRALAEIQKLKSNPSYATEKKTSTKSSSGGKSGSSQKSSGSSKSSSSSKQSGSSKTSSTKTDNTAQRNAAIEAATKQAQAQITELFNKISAMSEEERKTAKVKIQNTLKEIEQIQAALKQSMDRIKAIYG